MVVSAWAESRLTRANAVFWFVGVPPRWLELPLPEGEWRAPAASLEVPLPTPCHGTFAGSGLGLWIAKAFVGANGGRLQANSDGADQGTTVSLFLPYNADVTQPEAAPDD